MENTQKGTNLAVPIVILVLLAVVAGVIFLRKPKAPSQNTALSTETSVPAISGTPTVDKSGTQTIQIEEGSFYFKPNVITVKKGIPVKIILTDAGGTHNLVIDQLNVQADTISDGASTTVSFTPTTAGTYQFYCSIDGHKDKGMVGSLIVQ